MSKRADPPLLSADRDAPSREPTETPPPDAAASVSADAAEARRLFEAMLVELGSRVSLFVRRGFFEPLQPAWLREGELALEAPTLFLRDWVKDHYLDELSRAATEVSGAPVAVSLTARPAEGGGAPAAREEPPPLAPPAPVPLRAPPRGSTRTTPDPDGAPPRARLSPKYTFDTFVAGPSNQMAYQACQAVAEHPGRRYSPLFLFGKTGLGKTHLLHSIGNEAMLLHPQLRVVYMSAEQWVNEYIHDIRHQRFDEFRRRYRSGCDLLLIDDIQFLAGKDASQDEFFHTFNSLHDSRRQIVVTADRYPHEIEGLEHRLMTRLSWGLIADIQSPEVETRVAILQRKAEILGLALAPEVVHYLADHIQSSVRALEGALIRLSAYAAVTGGRLDLEAAKQYLGPVLSKRTDLSLERILQVVSAYYDLKPAELKSKSRQRRITLARQMAMYLARKHLGVSLPEIGRSFGRDHTTVLSSVRKIAGLLATDAATQAVVARLERDLL